jgi:putative spermidine/putrescine transport system permease protein
MRLSGTAAILLRIGTGIALAFIYIPLFVIALYAFSESRLLEWPPPGLTLDWFDKAFTNEGAREALWTSVRVGLGATLVAIVLGTLASIAVARYRFFGRETISFLVILPIALPGIVTGMALNSTFTQFLGLDLGLFTIVVAHATFCIVVVYNNVIARLRRISSWQTFWYVTMPNMRTALVAGALLAFALSFDEIIVTTFTAGADQTLPIWIFSNLSRPNQLPIVNVVAVVVILLSAIPVYLAHRLTREESISARGGRPIAESAAVP